MGDVVSWYVLHTKPRKETQVFSYLCGTDIEVFYPTVKVKPVNPRASKIRPYFPGYVFVHANLDETGPSALQWLPGTLGLVSFGGEPAAVPDNFVHELKRHIAEIKASGGLNLDGLRPGDTLQITSGSFAGYEAIFDLRLNDSERIQVFLKWLGRRLKVVVNANAIEKKRVR